MRKNTGAANLQPIQYQRTLRPHIVRGATHIDAGEVAPIAFLPVLRGDGGAGSLRIPVGMEETVERLYNSVHFRAKATFVPFTASERFDGRDDFERAWAEEPDGDGVVKPLFDIDTRIGTAKNDELYRRAGLHAVTDEPVNRWYKEAYELMINADRRRSSPDFADKKWSITSHEPIAPCFWAKSVTDMMVPHFDDARIDGAIPLQIVQAKMPVRGIGKQNGVFQTGDVEVNEAGGNVVTYDNSQYVGVDGGTNRYFRVSEDPDNPGFPNIYAEMQNDGITISLSNIELAKKTAAFAKLRANMDVEEDYLLDLLCQGLRIPQQHEKEPIVLSTKSSIIGLSTRFATDNGNLDKSVTTGMSFVDLPVRMPPTDIGGVIIITAEIVPDQLFERMEDPFLAVTKASDMPNTMRDLLDPQKVDLVPNRRIDVAHSAPDGQFAFEPLNNKWRYNSARLGGRFYRPDPSADLHEERNHFWTPEAIDPAYHEDFLLATDLPTEVFADTDPDYLPFTVQCLGTVNFLGNTQFGGQLQEASGEYDEILSQVDTARLDGQLEG